MAIVCGPITSEGIGDFHVFKHFRLVGAHNDLRRFFKNEEPTPLNPSGSRPASNLFILSGGVLMGTATGLILGVWRIQRRMRRPRAEFPRAEWLHPSNLPAILGLIAIAIAVWVGNSRVSALSVLFAMPCFASSWYWIGRKRKTRPQKSSFNRRIIEV